MERDKIQLDGIDHVALPTADVARAERFFCEVLGFQVVPRPAFSFDGRWLEHESVRPMVHLIHVANYRPRTSELNTRGAHFALRCQDMEHAAEVLKQHGVEWVERCLPDYGFRQFFFQDPDGNVIEIGEWPKRSRVQQDD